MLKYQFIDEDAVRVLMKEKIVFLLGVAGGILLLAGWIVAIYAYPRLPEYIPRWLDFMGGQNILVKKSLTFFFFPGVQTLFCLIFFLTAAFISRKKPSPDAEKQARQILFLKKEYLFLTLIFINLVFIHLETSLIYLAYNADKGFNKLYFILICAVIVLLFPYYRARKKSIGEVSK